MSTTGSSELPPPGGVLALNPCGTMAYLYIRLNKGVKGVKGVYGRVGAIPNRFFCFLPWEQCSKNAGNYWQCSGLGEGFQDRRVMDKDSKTDLDTLLKQTPSLIQIFTPSLQDSLAGVISTESCRPFQRDAATCSLFQDYAASPSMRSCQSRSPMRSIIRRRQDMLRPLPRRFGKLNVGGTRPALS